MVLAFHSLRALRCMALAAVAVAAGCGGQSGDGPGAAPPPAVAVSGRAALVDSQGTPAAAEHRFRVRAVAASGAVYTADAEDHGAFVLTLPAEESYVMGFEHAATPGGDMHFAGSVVFPCGSDETDHFFVSGGTAAVDLGTVAVRLDGQFARPERNPLEQFDADADGTPDARDPDTSCVPTGDWDHDGFYDDDMDRDGHHDDDFDHDGHHDCEVGGMAHRVDEPDACPVSPAAQTPMIRAHHHGTVPPDRTPGPTATPAGAHAH